MESPPESAAGAHIPMRLNHLRSLTVSVTSPRRGEVGSRLRDPGEGDPSPACIHSPLTRNARARRAHSDLSPPELGFTRVRHLKVAEVGYIRLRLGRGEERLRQSAKSSGGCLLESGAGREPNLLRARE